MGKWTIDRIQKGKGREKLACLTAYDYSMARIADETGMALLLVGDSLAMTMLGHANTLPVTVDEMLHHAKAVVRGVQQALVVADLPFLSYEASPQQAWLTAGRFIKEGGADAVKIEGGALRAPTVRMLADNGIPVLGHIGLTPQRVHQTSGYKVQGRSDQDAEQLMRDAAALEEAGVFALVIECVPAALSARITQAVAVPTIGIGAGPACDGQILVIHDMLGLYAEKTAKFVKQYADLGSEMRRALGTYRQEVEQGAFPSASHSY